MRSTGDTHDTYCRNESQVLLSLEPGNGIGDKGYVGNALLTPITKPIYRELVDWEKRSQHWINKIRCVIERVIAHFKDWEHAQRHRPP